MILRRESVGASVVDDEKYFYFRSDSDQLEVQDISDSEVSNSSAVLPGFTRIQSRLNPVPESLNSPDIAPGDFFFVPNYF